MFYISLDEGGGNVKRLSAVLASIMMLSAVAQGERYIFADDSTVMGHMFWVNTDNACIYANQLLLPATITDFKGKILTTDALMTYDTRWGNINMMHYGNYCIFNAGYANASDGNSLIAQTGIGDGKVAWLQDYIGQAYAPYIRFDQKTARFAGKHELLSSASGIGSGQGDVINIDEGATGPDALSARSSPIAVLTSSFGHRYYLYDQYRIGDPNFFFYVCTMIVQSDDTFADGLVFFRKLISPDATFLVIITVFENEWMKGYSMAGIYDPGSSAYLDHVFAFINSQRQGYYVSVY